MMENLIKVQTIKNEKKNLHRNLKARKISVPKAQLILKSN
jgi:hypothetical protein